MGKRVAGAGLCIWLGSALCCKVCLLKRGNVQTGGEVSGGCSIVGLKGRDNTAKGETLVTGWCFGEGRLKGDEKSWWKWGLSKFGEGAEAKVLLRFSRGPSGRRFFGGGCSRAAPFAVLFGPFRPGGVPLEGAVCRRKPRPRVGTACDRDGHATGENRAVTGGG